MTTTAEAGAIWSTVVSRVPVRTEETTLVHPRYGAGDPIQIPRWYLETLECGCSREVKVLVSVHRDYAVRPSGIAYALGWRRRTAHPLTVEEAIRLLKPKRRRCPNHQAVAARAEWLARCLELNRHIRRLERGRREPR